MLESLIDTYGYLAVMIGTLFEGETILRRWRIALP